MIKYISLFIVFFSGLNYTYSQGEYKTTNYYGIEGFVINVYKSEEAKKIQDIFANETDITNLLKFKTGLIHYTTTADPYKTIFIEIDYFINRNYSAEDQFYGNYGIRVQRLLNIPNSEYYTNPYATIFSSEVSFIITNPIINDWENELKQIITNLINEFALDYKSSF